MELIPYTRPEHFFDSPVLETMKIKHRNNLIRLIFIHLLLLVYPLVSKTIHVHHEKPVHHEFLVQVCFDQPEEICPVCDFEFLNFIPSAEQTVSDTQFIIPVKISPAPHIGHHQFVEYFSLRAPPVA